MFTSIIICDAVCNSKIYTEMLHGGKCIKPVLEKVDAYKCNILMKKRFENNLYAQKIIDKNAHIQRKTTKMQISFHADCL